MADDSGNLEDDLRSILADDSDDGKPTSGAPDNTGDAESALPDPEARYRGTMLENAPYSQNIEDRRTTLNDDPSQPGRSVDTTPHTSGYGPMGTGGGWDTLNNSMWFAAGGSVPDPADDGWGGLAPGAPPQEAQAQPQAQDDGWGGLPPGAPQQAQDDGWGGLPPAAGPDDQPQAEGVLKSMGRTLIHAAAPFVASLPGIVAGAEAGGAVGGAIGTPLAPFTAGASVPVLGFIGAMLGAAGAAAVTGGMAEEAQDWMENAVGISDAPQRAANAAAHPIATGVAELLPNAAAFKVGPLAGSLLSRATMGAGMGGLEAAKEYAENGELDPGEIAKQAAVGALFNQERSGTAAALNPVRTAVGRFIPGRPGVTTTAEDAQAFQDSSTPPPPVGSVGTAAENSPNDADRRLPPDVASRLQTATLATVRDRGNQGIYQKGGTAPDNSSIVTTGDIQPNVQAAIDANKPEAPPPQVNGQSTGIVEGAQEQGMLPPKAAAAVQQSAPSSPLLGAREAPSPPLGNRQPAPGEEPPNVAQATDVQNPNLPNIAVEKADLPPGYIARSNNDGTKVYVSPNVPDQMDVNGHVFPPRDPLIVHEILERHRIAQIQDAIQAGTHPPMSNDGIYDSAHEYAGTAGEFAYLQEHIGTPAHPFTKEDFAEYQRQMRNLSVQNKNATGTPPADLYRFMDDQHYAAAHVHQAGDEELATAQMQRQAMDAVHAKVRTGQGADAQGDITGSLNPDRVAAPQSGDQVNDALANFGKPGADVTAAVKQPPGLARALELLKAHQELSPKAKADLSQKLQTASPEVVQQVYNRLRRNRDVVPGVGVQAKSGPDLARKQGAIDAATRAFQKFPPAENEGSLKVADKATLVTRLKGALAEGGSEALAYKANDTPAEVQWMHEAKRIVSLDARGKLYPKQINEFTATEKALRSGNKDAAREVQANKRAEADIAKSRRSGDEAVEQATAKTYGPGRNEVEDELIDKIDRQRSGVPDEEHDDDNGAHSPFDVPEGEHESAPKAATVESVKAEAGRSREATDLSKLSPEELTKFADEMLAHTPEALKRSITRRGKAGRPIDTERFKVGESRAGDSLENMYANGKPITKADAYRVRQAKGAEEEAAYSLSEGLSKLDKQEVSYNTALRKHGESIPDVATDAKLQETLYHARENKATKTLSARELTAFNRYNKPLFTENDKLADYIRSVGGDNLIGPKVEDHQMRIRKGSDPSLDAMAQRTGANPLEGGRSISVKKSPQFDRHFQVLEHPSGQRQVIGINNDGKSFTKWNHYVKTEAREPIDFKDGGKFTHGGVDYTMREARTKEIEDNAKFEDGSKARYEHNSLLSAMVANQYLHTTAEHLRFIEKQKGELRDAKLMFDSKKDAPDGFVEPDLPQFKKTYVAPQIAHVLNDYHDAGLGLGAVKGIARFLTKTLFWNPIAHIANVGTHWFVARGKDWAWPPAYARLVRSAGEAMKSVITQDEEYRRLQDAGAGFVLGGVLQKEGLQNMARGIGVSIKDQPEQWQKTADILGVGVPQLGRAVMDNSSKIMWAGNDMFLMQLIKEGEAKGLTTRDAIATAEKHFPNYRVGSTLLGSGKGGRFMSQVMQDQSVFAFGRYHVGMMQSYAHMVKDLAVGTGHARLDAIGHLMALGVLAFAVKPLLDKAAQLVTGNPHAFENPRGPLTLPTHIARAAAGREDLMQGARGVMTLNPLITTVMETLFNKDFAGNPIVQPGDFANAAHGSPRAAGKVLTAEAAHAAQGAISPLNTLMGSGKVVQGKPIGVSGQLRDQVTDVHNPSDKETAFFARQPKKAQEAIKAADKKAGPIMKGYNDLTRGLP